MKVLVLGGARSGKSRHAEQLVRRLGDRRRYVATATVTDHEMADRIARHRADRGDGWETIEEPIHVERHLDAPGRVVLLDCLTLWLSNVFADLGDGDPTPHIDRLVAAVAAAPGPLVLVGNELGSGIVPMHPLSRRFRDAAGRLHQRLAAVCDRTWLCVAGRVVDLPAEPPPLSPIPKDRPMTAPTLHSLRAALPVPDAAARQACQALLDDKTKPVGSLGRVEQIAVRLAGITGLPRPPRRRPAVVVTGADHGVARRGVSAYPAEVTRQMLLNFAGGGAAICVLARQIDAQLVVVDAGVTEALPPGVPVRSWRIGAGTADLVEEPAMTRTQAEDAVLRGVALANELIDGGADLLCLGEMGIGNTTAATALTAALLDLPVADVLGRGTGVDDEGLARKQAAIEQALARHGDDREALGVLASLGGFEIAGLVGVAVGAAHRRVPVLLDGFISCAAGLVASRLAPGSEHAMLASHGGVEPGLRHQLDALGLTPLLDLDLRLGEGSGAALAVPLIQAALAILAEMASFSEAGVSTAG